MTGPSTKCYFNECLFTRVLTLDKNIINQQLWAFEVPWSPTGFMLGLPPRGDFWKQSKWPWNIIRSMPRTNPCRLYIHLALLRKRTWTTGSSAFSTNESAWSVIIGHGLSVSFVCSIGENRQLVTDEQVEFGKSPVEVHRDCGRISDHFRGISRLYPNLIKENRRMSTCNRLDLHTLGSQPTAYHALSRSLVWSGPYDFWGSHFMTVTS